MKIVDLEIKNYGSGKSAILQAITFFKERVGPYSGYSTRNPVNSGAEFGEIFIEFKLYPAEERFLQNAAGSISFDKTLGGRIRFDKTGNVTNQEFDPALTNLLQTYSPEQYPDLGMFDYNDAHRIFQESSVGNLALGGARNLPLGGSNAQRERQRRVQPGTAKYAGLKQYLAQLKLSELLQMQKEKNFDVSSKLTGFRKLFNELLSPKEFLDVEIGTSVKFVVKSPSGEIDFDDLSSGEKELLFFYVDLIHLNPRNSIILIDEPDLHLNQELERRILPLLRSFGSNNQFWIVTHSLAIMDSVEPGELFRVSNYDNRNQLSNVFDNREKYELFRSVTGNIGLITLGERIVFCEGAEHTDVAILQAWFAHLKGTIVFVASGGKAETTLLSNRMIELLKSSSKYNQYFAIRDRDFLSDPERTRLMSGTDGRLRIWDRYELENYLLDFETIAELANELGVYSKRVSATEIQNGVFEIAKGLEKDFSNLLIVHKINEQLHDIRRTIMIRPDGQLEGADKLLKPIMSKEEFDDLRKNCSRQVNEWLSDRAWTERLPGKKLVVKFVNSKMTGITYDRFRRLLVNRIVAKGRIPRSVLETVNTIVTT